MFTKIDNLLSKYDDNLKSIKKTMDSILDYEGKSIYNPTFHLEPNQKDQEKSELDDLETILDISG